MMASDWTGEGNGAQIAALAETVYLVRDLGQNGEQIENQQDLRSISRVSAMIVRSPDADSVKKYAKTVIRSSETARRPTIG
jgi:hypothetical protein